ncbi:hypothetical protein [Aurantimonas sp. VKM B-3413]|uniref:DUF7146 domain-containing protein n=1 Tax=Aurantimonas sp. VKM B-3413 TaxID=2779401 RepID=UPI001E5CC248|nr:hypothetical protein [Aurantimonas sp. VKM B-3413]MCB8835955.1 hypothetical protein [Aurantimonas sp. VKM B-3413]
MSGDRDLTDLFVEEARAVTVGEAVERLGVAGLRPAGIGESVGPCPVAGGRDGFSVNTVKNAWNCRRCGDGGHDGIGLAAHNLGLDVKRREAFLAACAAVLGRPVPEGGAESDEARAEREAALAARREAAATRAARETRTQADFRERERRKAAGKWLQADGKELLAYGYLEARLGLGRRVLPVLPALRVIAAEPYWHGTGEDGRAVAIHEGAAMVLPFVDSGGTVIGCHLTWLDPSGPKGRPTLCDPATGERLPTKKMRGSKKGGLLPLVGFGLHADGRILPDPARTRLVLGEGIENVLAIGVAEGFRADTLYAAAGDLGNLAGPADGRSAFSHPELTKVGKDGKARPLRVAGPVPKPDQDAGDAVQAPAGLTEILLVADGDSERYATAAAMLRAEARLSAGGRAVTIAWPPKGMDFAELLSGAGERRAA